MYGNMIWEAIQKTKTNTKDLDVIWLDFANAYGSVPHTIISTDVSYFSRNIQKARNIL